MNDIFTFKVSEVTIVRNPTCLLLHLHHISPLQTLCILPPPIKQASRQFCISTTNNNCNKQRIPTNGKSIIIFHRRNNQESININA